MLKAESNRMFIHQLRSVRDGGSFLSVALKQHCNALCNVSLSFSENYQLFNCFQFIFSRSLRVKTWRSKQYFFIFFIKRARETILRSVGSKLCRARDFFCYFFWCLSLETVSVKVAVVVVVHEVEEDPVVKVQAHQVTQSLFYNFKAITMMRV